MIPQFLAIALFLSIVGAFPVYSVAAASPSTSAQCTPDFAFGATTGSGMVTRGATVLLGITITSICGFTGDVSWSASVTSPPNTAKNGITLSRPTYHPIDLTTTHTSGLATFTVGTTENTLMTMWMITVTASGESNGNSLRHSATVSVTVDDFTIVANPTSITTSVGKTVTSAVTATSLNSFSGQIFYSGLLFAFHRLTRVVQSSAPSAYPGSRELGRLDADLQL